MFHGDIPEALAKGLQVLRARIDKSTPKIPSSKLDESLNIATWNIREFGKKRRTEAAIHYIAEILGQFDLIGIVELRDDLTDLGRVLPILGPYWHVVYSDMIPDAGGNHERVAYVFDTRSVAFTGLAAEANPARTKKGAEYVSEISWWRNPYIASFRAGNFDFMVITAHVRWETVESRTRELQLLADWIDAKRRDKHCEDKDMLVMGDFNIPSRNDALFKAITSRGLSIPTALRAETFGTNLAKNKRYDQILHYPVYPENFTNCGGVLDFYTGGIEPLFPGLTEEKFTYQLSDHLPLWIQVNTDIEGHLLDQIIRD